MELRSSSRLSGSKETGAHAPKESLKPGPSKRRTAPSLQHLSSTSQATSSAIKRPLPSPSATTTPYQDYSKQARLTRENLKQHTRASRKAMDKLSEPAVGQSANAKTNSDAASTAPSKCSTSSSRSKNSDAQFGIKLARKNVVEAYSRTKRPRDADDIEERLDRTRRSASPDEEVFRCYQGRLEGVNLENDVRDALWPLLAKTTYREGYFTNTDASWCAVKHTLTDGFTPPKPDKSESYTIARFPDRAVTRLGWVLKPTPGNAAMPSLCVEFKKPSGSMPSAGWQSAYNGAVMVEAARRIQEYVDKPAESLHEHTQAITLAFNGENLRIYANHAVHGSEGLEYHSVLLFSDEPPVKFDSFKQAYKRVRNAHDWAYEKATSVLEEVREHEQRTIATEKLAAAHRAVMRKQKGRKNKQDDEEADDVEAAKPKQQTRGRNRHRESHQTDVQQGAQGKQLAGVQEAEKELSPRAEQNRNASTAKLCTAPSLTSATVDGIIHPSDTLAPSPAETSHEFTESLHVPCHTAIRSDSPSSVRSGSARSTKSDNTRSSYVTPLFGKAQPTTNSPTVRKVKVPKASVSPLQSASATKQAPAAPTPSLSASRLDASKPKGPPQPSLARNPQPTKKVTASDLAKMASANRSRVANMAASSGT